MTASVVDTNVAVVANGAHPQAGQECMRECILALQGIQQQGRVVVDSGMLIFTEYFGKLSLSGQPGVGDAFFKWLWSIQGDPERCEPVDITPADGSFREFPADPALNGFHADDHKFVAVALASKSDPEVLNAVDSDWWAYRTALANHGVRVRFLCPGLFAGRGRPGAPGTQRGRHDQG